MPDKFAGRYLRNPIDFKAIATERDLIDVGDDPESPDVDEDVLSFTALAAEVPLPGAAGSPHDAVVTVLNEMITTAEKIIESYAGSYGYVTPLYLIGTTTPDPIVKRFALDWFWIDARQRRKIITGNDAADEREKLTRLLEKLAKGVPLLGVSLSSSTTDSLGGEVADFTSSERVFSRETLEWI